MNTLYHNVVQSLHSFIPSLIFITLIYMFCILSYSYSLFRYIVGESEVRADGIIELTGHRLLSVDLDPVTRAALLDQGAI